MDSVYIVQYNYEYEGSYILGVYSTFEEAVNKHLKDIPNIVEKKTYPTDTLAYEYWVNEDEKITIEKWKVG